MFINRSALISSFFFFFLLLLLFRGQASVIDLAWCNFAAIDLVSDFSVMHDIGFSDHFPVKLSLHGFLHSVADSGPNSAAQTQLRWFQSKSVAFKLAIENSMITFDTHELDMEGLKNALIQAIRSAASGSGMLKPASKISHLSNNNDTNCAKSQTQVARLFRNCRNHNFSEPWLSTWLIARHDHRMLLEDKNQSYINFVCREVNFAKPPASSCGYTFEYF